MRIYLAGPMRGIPYFNYPSFDYAAQLLRADGHIVFSPPDRDRAAYGNSSIENNKTGSESDVDNPAFTIEDCMAADCEWICRNAEAVALLPGWKNSKGANAELALAQALGLTVIILGKKFVLPKKEPG